MSQVARRDTRMNRAAVQELHSQELVAELPAQ